jgi:uncharacterized protein involved in outer membrane biogenesis
MRRRFFVVLAALILLYVGAHFAAREVSTGPLRALIEKNLTQVLGLEVSLDELVVALLPSPHLRAEGVRVVNLPGRPSPHLLSIDRLELGVALWPLFERRVVVDTLEIEGADVHVETDAKGRLAGDFRLGALVNDGDSDSLQLELRHFEADTLRVFYRDGRDGTSHSVLLESVAVESTDLDSEISLEAHGEFDGSVIALSGKVGSLRELLHPTGPFPADLQGQLFEATVEAKGTVLELWKLEGLDLAVSAEIPELVIEGRSLPQLGTIRFGGQLSDLDGSLGLERLSLDTTKTAPVLVDIHGKLDSLLELKEVDIDARVETASLDFLAPLLQSLVDFPLPTISSLSGKAKLSDGKGGLGLEGTLRLATKGDAIVMHAEGGARDLRRAPRVDMKLDGRADDLASITALIPGAPQHGPLGPVTASGRLKGQADALGASGIEVRVGSKEKVWVELDGSIADVVALRDVDLALSFGAVSLHHLSEMLERELSRTSPLEGSAALSDKDGSLGLEHLRLHGGENSPVEIHLDARFDDLPARDEIEIELGLRGQDTRVLGAIAGVDLPIISPVEFQGKLQGSEKHLEANEVAVRLGETRIRGSLSGSFARDARPSVKARLVSKLVRLQDLGLTRSETASAPPSSDVRAASGGPPDGQSPLPFEDLRHVDLDIGVQLDRLTGYRGLDATDVRVALRLQDGELVVKDAGATFQGGHLSANMRADARTPLAKLQIALKTRGADLTRVMAQFQEKTDFSGTVDADIGLQAVGGTVDALRQSLAGHVGVSVRDGNAASQIAREFVLNLAGAVLPGMKTKKLPSIGCGAVDLEIADGIATVRSFLLQEKEITVTGTGKVDLAGGVYDLRFVPTTTNPGILSVAPEVEVKGPLDAPSFHPIKRTLVTSFGRGLLQNVRKAGAALIGPRNSRATPQPQDACRLPNPGAA